MATRRGKSLPVANKQYKPARRIKVKTTAPISEVAPRPVSFGFLGTTRRGK